MSKYINAEWLIGKLKEVYRLKHYSDYIDGRNDMIDEVKILIAEMPPADVIEVVRCEHCKHSKHNIISHGRYCFFGECSLSFVADDFFCKNGERKETE